MERHPVAGHARKKAPSPYPISPASAFYVFLAANLVAALYAPIQDCDETFNYWEPSHYLSHGYGLQTWEYAPQYALRSWLYAGVHAFLSSIRRLLPRSDKEAEFYFVRYILATVCAICQTKLFLTAALSLHARVAFIWLVAMITSPGNFNASTSYLPSSFAMYTAMVSFSFFMDWRANVKTVPGLFWSAVGSVLGWPFAGALVIPFVVEEVLLASLGSTANLLDSIVRLGHGVYGSLILVFFDTTVNSLLYRSLQIVPWNMIRYNVFPNARGSSQSQLYGTEAWTFYFRNLLLNFHVWFVLALLSLPLFLLSKTVLSATRGFQSALRTLVFLSPFYLWLGIFTLQPHKEERFMYPVYPFLAMNAAVSLHIFLVILGASTPGTLLNRIPARVKLLGVSSTLLVATVLGLARIYGLYSGYSAPMELYAPLQELGAAHAGDFVCFGKDWYRFPTSYFLPHDMHAKFIRSDFHGLLPGEFAETGAHGFGFRSGTYLPANTFNDQNQEDRSKYVPLSSCSFLVDTRYVATEADASSGDDGDGKGQDEDRKELGGVYRSTIAEPDYVSDTAHWEVVQCLPLLDTHRTSTLARAIWVPEWDVIPARFRRHWAEHCLLRRR